MTSTSGGLLSHRTVNTSHSTNSLKILPTKYKIRLPAKCAQVNCLISFKYELDRPSSLLPSAQIMWIRCAVPLPRPNKTWHQEGEGVARVQCVGHLTADSLGHAPTCELCPVFEIIHEKNTQHMFTRVSSFWLLLGLSHENNAMDWQSGRKINL